MRVHHFHFGKDGGAERFFVHLVNAFARRGVEQSCVIRKNRVWRRDIETVADITESNFRNVSLDRFLLPIKVHAMAESHKPDAIMAWAPRASELMPAYKGCIKLSRLGIIQPSWIISRIPTSSSATRPVSANAFAAWDGPVALR